MTTPQSPTPNLTQLLQYSPNELSSGVLIADWIESKASSTFEFDLSQIDKEPKDSVSKYLNWVCLNAKVFNNFGILLNSAQMNNFIAGKSTEIYIILKQLHDRMREKLKTQTNDTAAAAAATPPTKSKANKIPSISTVQSITAAASQKRKSQSGRTSNKPVATFAVNLTPPPKFEEQEANVAIESSKASEAPKSSSRSKLSVFPSLSLAISPTHSHERIENAKTTSHSRTRSTNDAAAVHSSHSYSQSVEMHNNQLHIPTIQEHNDGLQQNSNNNIGLSLLTPDLSDVIEEQKKRQLQFTSNIKSDANLKIENPFNALEQFGDCIIYDDIKLFGENIDAFLNEKEKLELKLNEAMSSYQSNNVEYLNNVVEQFRIGKMKSYAEITDQQQQSSFLRKLRYDLEKLDESLQQQFRDSSKTLYTQLINIHHNRLKEFAEKLAANANASKEESNLDNANDEAVAVNVNVNNNNNDDDAKPVAVADDSAQLNNEALQDREELNLTLREVSSLLEKCWKKQMAKQIESSDKQKEVATLKEILCVYQNLSKLIQLQSDALQSTISDFQHLCNEQVQPQPSQNEQQIAANVMNDPLHSSPVKTHVDLAQPEQQFQYYPISQTHPPIQVLSSAEAASRYYQAFSKSPRKRKKKSTNKKSSKSGNVKTPAFSFEYNRVNRQTVSSKNKAAAAAAAAVKQVGSKKKLKRTKVKKST
eukprot:CAMPEP_0202706108 /NCGR_PEP_ID=MMETSP1385-20130828/18583_1 /ASSEMBLY_ACC=CAM_ASM_000861 /TAXON_ID=933848 /ORGANISM="Elphidium margaritaceum" /LENGTH=704 /DNA_ID=CAMNT_0049364501 /DNA_START=53 /DNA_END=2167 /DNA_ORIENTATION=-